MEFLKKSCLYSLDKAETRRWEVKYQMNQRCSPILMKPNTSGTIMFKSVLQRQEIERHANNRDELIRIILGGEEAQGEIRNGKLVIVLLIVVMYIYYQWSFIIHFQKVQ